MRKSAYAALLSSALVFVGGNLGAASAPRPTPVDFDRDVQPIFDRSCVACHRVDGPMAGLVLEQPFARDQMVGVKSPQSGMLLVEPGHTERSYMYLKLTGLHIKAGGTGYPMPKFAGNPVSAADIAMIGRWISEGARQPTGVKP